MRGLAAQVVADRFRALRIAQGWGWLHLVVGPAYAVFGIVLLIVTRQDEERAMGVLAVFNGALPSLVGVYRTFLGPKRIRRSAEQILQCAGNAAERDGWCPPPAS